MESLARRRICPVGIFLTLAKGECFRNKKEELGEQTDENFKKRKEKDQGEKKQSNYLVC